MTYKEILPIAKQGYLIRLPNFKGFFKWDYGKERLAFTNNDFKCEADKLDILNREDFYYII